jgi:hypothetical protein
MSRPRFGDGWPRDDGAQDDDEDGAPSISSGRPDVAAPIENRFIAIVSTKKSAWSAAPSAGSAWSPAM